MDIGDMDTTCLDCGAMIWFNEKAKKNLEMMPLKFLYVAKKEK
jgi:hypothetical protein